jgi:hypothetical protein
MRHVIVEGPDGSGKSTMVERIHTTLGLPVHERASTSKGGPVDDLAGWVERDLAWMQGSATQAMVYDRHPIISEPIYGPNVRGWALPGFRPVTDRLQLASRRLEITKHAVIIFCRPPIHVVRDNVEATLDNQLAGVLAALPAIYQGYRQAEYFWPGLAWHYDYTTDDVESLLSRIKEEVNR